MGEKSGYRFAFCVGMCSVRVSPQGFLGLFFVCHFGIWGFIYFYFEALFLFCFGFLYLFCFVLFEIGSHYVVLGGLEHAMVDHADFIETPPPACDHRGCD